MPLSRGRPLAALAAAVLVGLVAALQGANAACTKSNVKRPVCGLNQKTYPNREAAICAKVKVRHPGPCPICPAIKSCAKAAKTPVCANKKTYCSACAAKALKLKFTLGPCRPPCNGKGATCNPGAKFPPNGGCCPGLKCTGNLQVGICTGTAIAPGGGGPGGGPGGMPGGGPGGMPGGGPGGMPGGGPGGQPGGGLGGIGGGLG